MGHGAPARAHVRAPGRAHALGAWAGRVLPPIGVFRTKTTFPPKSAFFAEET